MPLFWSENVYILHKNAFSTVVLKVEYFPLEQFAQLRFGSRSVWKCTSQAFVDTQAFFVVFFWNDMLLLCHRCVLVTIYAKGCSG